MAKKELKLRALVAPTETVIASAFAPDEVKRIIADESVLNEKDRVVLEKLQPIIYNEEEGVYHSLGGKIADAFRTGAEFRKSLG